MVLLSIQLLYSEVIVSGMLCSKYWLMVILYEYKCLCVYICISVAPIIGETSTISLSATILRHRKSV